MLGHYTTAPYLFPIKIYKIGDPDGNRTRVTALKGPCLNRLTTGPLKLKILYLTSKMVGATGFEPATPWSQTRCATKLRYAPF